MTNGVSDPVFDARVWNGGGVARSLSAWMQGGRRETGEKVTTEVSSSNSKNGVKQGKF
jgi:hypothetical protein